MVSDQLLRPTTRPQTRQLTEEDYRMFATNPISLPDKQFLLEEDSDDGHETVETLYEVTEVQFRKGSWAYLIRFEGWYNQYITVSDQEMMDMLKKSVLVEGKY